MSSTSIGKTKKFRLNQPLQNSLKKFKDFKKYSNHKYDPYRKYDATLIEITKDTTSVYPNLPYINTRGIKINVNTGKDNNTGKSNTPIGKKRTLVFTNTSEKNMGKASEKDMGKASDQLSDNSKILPLKAINELEELKNRYGECSESLPKVKLKCGYLELIGDSPQSFPLMSESISTKDSDNFTKRFSSCLPRVRKYFENLESPSKFSTKYVPEIDNMLHYSEMTETEIVLLQKRACGCNPLSWDDLEKMYLKQDQSDIRPVNDQMEDMEGQDPLDLRSEETSTNINIPLRTPLFYRHKSDIKEKHSTLSSNNDENQKQITATKSAKKPAKKRNKKDPLKLLKPNMMELEDNDNIIHVNYVPFDYEAPSPEVEEISANNGNMLKHFLQTLLTNTDEEVEVPPEPAEIYGMPKPFIDMVQNRLNSLRLHSVDSEAVSSCSQDDDYTIKISSTCSLANTEAEKEISTNNSPVTTSQNAATCSSENTVDFVKKAIKRRFTVDEGQANNEGLAQRLSHNLDKRYGKNYSKRCTEKSPKRLTKNLADHIIDSEISVLKQTQPQKGAMKSTPGHKNDPMQYQLLKPTVSEPAPVDYVQLNTIKVNLNKRSSKPNTLDPVATTKTTAATSNVSEKFDDLIKSSCQMVDNGPSPSLTSSAIPIIQFVADGSDSDDSINFIPTSQEEYLNTTASPSSEGTLKTQVSTPSSPRCIFLNKKTDWPSKVDDSSCSMLPSSVSLMTKSIYSPVVSSPDCNREDSLIRDGESGSHTFTDGVNSLNSSSHDVHTLNFDKARVIDKEEAVRIFGELNVKKKLTKKSSVNNLVFLTIPFSKPDKATNSNEVLQVPPYSSPNDTLS